MSENENKVNFTPKVEDGKVDESPTINPEDISIPNKNIEEDPQNELVEITEEDLNKKNYTKVSPTCYIQSIKNEEGEDKLDLFKILNPETGVVEKRELNDEEKKIIFIEQLKDSRRVFSPIKHKGNITTNQFGSKFKQKRKHKNKAARASRKANR